MSFVDDIAALVGASKNPLVQCPHDWPRVKLGSVAKIINGYPFPSSGFNPTSGTPVARIRDVVRGQSKTFFSGPEVAEALIEDGDLLIGMDGDFNLGRWKGGRALLNQRVCRLVPDPTYLDARFLAFVLPGYLKLINDNTPSLTVKHLSSRTLGSVPLPVPALDIQRRLADRMGDLFSEVDDGEEELRRGRSALETYRKSLLKAAVSGELTSDWRAANPSRDSGADLLQGLLADRRDRWEDDPKSKGKKYKEPCSPNGELPNLPEGWAWAAIEQLCSPARPVAYGVLQPGGQVENGVPLVRVMDIADGAIAISQLKRIAPAIADQYPRTRLCGGEVLLTVVGSIGRTAMVPPELEGANTARAVSVLPIAHAKPEWVELALRYEPYRQALEDASHEVARKTLNLEDVRAFPVPVPPAKEQVELVLQLKAELAAEGALKDVKAEINSASATLRQSILAAAFRGELIQ